MGSCSRKTILQPHAQRFVINLKGFKSPPWLVCGLQVKTWSSHGPFVSLCGRKQQLEAREGNGTIGLQGLMGPHVMGTTSEAGRPVRTFQEMRHLIAGREEGKEEAHPGRVKKRIPPPIPVAGW